MRGREGAGSKDDSKKREVLRGLSTLPKTCYTLREHIFLQCSRPNSRQESPRSAGHLVEATGSGLFASRSKRVDKVNCELFE